jgi:hypothetical protein
MRLVALLCGVAEGKTRRLASDPGCQSVSHACKIRSDNPYKQHPTYPVVHKLHPPPPRLARSNLHSIHSPDTPYSQSTLVNTVECTQQWPAEAQGDSMHLADRPGCQSVRHA